MSRKLIQAVLASAVVQSILGSIQGMADNLPFLSALSPWERRTQPKTGRKRLAFVEKAAEIVRQNPDYVPKRFDAGRFVSSADLLSAMMKIFVPLQQLFEGVEDTTMEIGIESYTQALAVYNFLQRLSKSEPGLDEAVKDLKKLLREAKANEDPNAPTGRKRKKGGKPDAAGATEPAKTEPNAKA